MTLCVWKMLDPAFWQPACSGQEWEKFDPGEWNFRYCPDCGAEIEFRPYHQCVWRKQGRKFLPLCGAVTPWDAETVCEDLGLQHCPWCSGVIVLEYDQESPECA